MEDVENLFDKAVGEIERMLNTKTIIGEPITVEGNTLIAAQCTDTDTYQETMRLRIPGLVSAKVTIRQLQVGRTGFSSALH